MTAKEPHEPQLPRGHGKWPLVTAILLIASIILAGVAIYQQQQIAVLNRNLSSVTTKIGGTSYYYESVPDSPNGTDVLFHGVTFTFLQLPLPDYSNPSNYTYSGSVRLSNGTLLNLNGKMVTIEVNATSLPGFALTFPDGFEAAFQPYNLTARYDYIPNEGGKPVYWLTYTGVLPTANPWLTQHDNLIAGIRWNATSTEPYFTYWALTIYVSAPS